MRPEPVPTVLADGAKHPMFREACDGSMGSVAAREYKALFQRSVEPGDCLLDVGAHIGTVAVAAALKGYRVVAVEPDPQNLRRLRRNVRLNRVEVEVLPVAVGTGGKAQWVVTASSFSRHLLRVRSKGAVVQVRTVPFADLMERVRPTHVKLDCEGAEYPAVLETDWHGVSGLWMEVHLFTLGPQKQTKYAELQRHLADCGFDVTANYIGAPDTAWLATVIGQRRQ